MEYSLNLNEIVRCPVKREQRTAGTKRKRKFEVRKNWKWKWENNWKKENLIIKNREIKKNGREKTRNKKTKKHIVQFKNTACNIEINNKYTAVDARIYFYRIYLVRNNKIAVLSTSRSIFHGDNRSENSLKWKEHLSCDAYWYSY